MRSDVLILGGGASGLLAAAALGVHGAQVCLLERNDRVGKKLLATGNGRCNLSNDDMRPCLYGEAEPFVRRLYEGVPPERVTGCLCRMGLMLTHEDGRIYPRTLQAASVLDVLRFACDRPNVHIRTGCEVVRLSASRHGGFTAETADGARFCAPYVLCAMGGSAAPQFGTDGSGARLLAALGHSVNPSLPALVQLRCTHAALRTLKGIRARAALTLLVDGRETAREQGEMLFTDYGVSGVCVMQLSHHAVPALAAGRDVSLLVHLLPELGDASPSWLASRIASLGDAPAQQLFVGALPRLLARCVLRQAHIPEQLPCSQLTASQGSALTDAFSRFPLPVCGALGFDHAQVTRGGVSLSEVNPSTMASSLFPGLYIAGEVLDVDGPCGGYNLHFAFAGALAASDAIARALAV